MGSGIRNVENFLHAAGMLILFEPFFGILLLDRLYPAFRSVILFHIFYHAFNIVKIAIHCSGTRDSLKKVIELSFGGCFKIVW